MQRSTKPKGTKATPKSHPRQQQQTQHQNKTTSPTSSNQRDASTLRRQSCGMMATSPAAATKHRHRKTTVQPRSTKQQQHQVASQPSIMSQNIPTLDIGPDSPLYGMVSLMLSQSLPPTNLINPHLHPQLIHSRRQTGLTSSIPHAGPIMSSSLRSFSSSSQNQPQNANQTKDSSSAHKSPTNAQDLDLALDQLHGDTQAFDSILSKALSQAGHGNSQAPMLHHNNNIATESSPTTKNKQNPGFDLDAEVAAIENSIAGLDTKPIIPVVQLNNPQASRLDETSSSESQSPHSSIIKIKMNQQSSSEKEGGDNVHLNQGKKASSSGAGEDYVSFEELLKKREFTRANPPPQQQQQDKPKLTPFPDHEALEKQLEVPGYIEPPKPLDFKHDSQFAINKKNSLLGRLASLDALKAESAALADQDVRPAAPPVPHSATQRPPSRSPAQVKQLLIDEAARQQALLDSQAKQKPKSKSAFDFFKSKIEAFDQDLDTAELKSLNFNDAQIKKTQEFVKNQEEFDKQMAENEKLGKTTQSLAKKVTPEPIKALKNVPKGRNGGYAASEVEAFGGSVLRSLGAATFFATIAVITGRLCKWQIDRRVWKIALLAQREDAIFQDPLALEDLTSLVTDILENFNMYNQHHLPSPPLDLTGPDGTPLLDPSHALRSPSSQEELATYFQTRLESTNASRHQIQPGTPLPSDVLETPSVREHLQSKLDQFHKLFADQGAYSETSPLHPNNFEQTKAAAAARNKSPLTIRDVIGDDGGIYQAFRHQTTSLSEVLSDTGNPISTSDHDLLSNITIENIITAMQEFKDKSQFHNVRIDGQYDYRREMLVGPTVPPLDHTGFKNVEIQKGYYIITPCSLYEPIQVNLPVKDDSGNHQINLKIAMHSVLVNRGWVPQHLLPTYLHSPLTEHELFSSDDLKVLAKRIHQKHDLPGDEVVTNLPFPQYLPQTLEFWDREENSKAVNVMDQAQTMNSNLTAILRTHTTVVEQVPNTLAQADVINPDQNTALLTRDHNDTSHVAHTPTQDAPHVPKKTAPPLPQTPTTIAEPAEGTTPPASWTWGSLVWGSEETTPGSTAMRTDTSAAVGTKSKITPYSIEYETTVPLQSPPRLPTIPAPQLTPDHGALPSDIDHGPSSLEEFQDEVLQLIEKDFGGPTDVDQINRLMTISRQPRTQEQIQTFIDANDAWVEETGSRLIYDAHGMKKPKLDRLGLTMNDVFRIDPEATIHHTLLPTDSTQSPPDPNEPFSLITTIQEPLATPPLPVTGILHYGATFDLYSQENQTAKINVRGLDHRTAFTFLTAPKFAFEMGLSPATLHIPLKDNATHTVSLLSGDQLRSSVDQAALSLHLPIPVIDCQDPVPYRSRVTPIFLNHEGANQLGKGFVSGGHFDTVRMELKRKGSDDYMRFKTMPETHLGYAVTWGSFSAIGAYMAYLQLNRPSVKNWFKDKLSSMSGAIKEANAEKGQLKHSRDREKM